MTPDIEELPLQDAPPTPLHETPFTQAKSELSELMTQAIHKHRPEVISRHSGKEAALLINREDLLALLDDYLFDARVSVGDEESMAVIEDLGVIGAGPDFEAAINDLVVQLRDYSRDFFDRLPFYMETTRAHHQPWLLRFALTPPDQQADLIYNDSERRVQESFRKGTTSGV